MSKFDEESERILRIFDSEQHKNAKWRKTHGNIFDDVISELTDIFRSNSYLDITEFQCIEYRGKSSATLISKVTGDDILDLVVIVRDGRIVLRVEPAKSVNLKIDGGEISIPVAEYDDSWLEGAFSTLFSRIDD